MVITKPPTDIEFYTDLDELSIYRFTKALGGEYKFLIVDYVKGEIELPENAFKVWEALYNSYCELTGNAEAMMVYVLACQINHLEMEQLIVASIISQLAKGKPKDVQELYFIELKEWGYTVQETMPFEEELERLMLKLRGADNKLRRKKTEYKDLTAKDESKDKSLSLTEQKVKLAISLKMNIDVKTTMVTEWVAYWKELENMANTIKNGRK